MTAKPLGLASRLPLDVQGGLSKLGPRCLRAQRPVMLGKKHTCHCDGLRFVYTYVLYIWC